MDRFSRELALARIAELLKGFKSGDVGLSGLIDSVPPLVRQIDKNDGWKESFISYWWTLEQVHGEAIEIGESNRLPKSRRLAVDVSVDGMIDLTENARAQEKAKNNGSF